jgi:pimeloyl-ACP methyl ester carboxylesterase
MIIPGDPISIPINFSNQNTRLAGTLYKPEGDEPHPLVVVLHAASGGLRTYPFYNHLKIYLSRAGIAVFLYDRRGCGESGGNFETASFDLLAEDAAAALQALQSRGDLDPAKMGVYGISQGGWIAPIVAAKRPDLAFQVIVSSSGVSPARQMNYAASYHLHAAGFSQEVIARAIQVRDQVNEYFRGRLPYRVARQEVESVQGEAWFSDAFLPAQDDLPEDITQDKWYYEMDYDPLAIWSRVRLPTLFIFAEQDRWVPVETSMMNFKAATAQLEDVTIERIKGADHLMGLENTEAGATVSADYLAILTGWLTDKLK